MTQTLGRGQHRERSSWVEGSAGNKDASTREVRAVRSAVVECTTISGDVNADDTLNLSDAVSILDHLFLGEAPELAPLCAQVSPGLPDTGQLDSFGDCAGQDGSYATGCPTAAEDYAAETRRLLARYRVTDNEQVETLSWEERQGSTKTSFAFKSHSRRQWLRILAKTTGKHFESANLLSSAFAMAVA